LELVKKKKEKNVVNLFFSSQEANIPVRLNISKKKNYKRLSQTKFKVPVKPEFTFQVSNLVHQY
jgi:Na+/serine symporter